MQLLITDVTYFMCNTSLVFVQQILLSLCSGATPYVCRLQLVVTPLVIYAVVEILTMLLYQQ